ncbi:hypothetical protein ACI4B7_27355, partial [Klebsiella pneumoniae]|uniref:hypothetical protein n=1 Tax=Klebsiella pneumoniae TaxID=573 RepID=UPI003854CFF4
LAQLLLAGGFGFGREVAVDLARPSASTASVIGRTPAFDSVCCVSASILAKAKALFDYIGGHLHSFQRGFARQLRSALFDYLSHGGSSS